MQKSLARLLANIKGKAPGDAYDKVKGIVDTIGGVLPRAGQLLPESEESGAPT